MGEHNGAPRPNAPVTGSRSRNQTPANNLPNTTRSGSSSLIPASALSKTSHPASPSSSKAPDRTKTMELPRSLPSLSGQSSSNMRLSEYELQKRRNIERNTDIVTALLGQPPPITPSEKNVTKKGRKTRGVVPESARRRGRSARKNLSL